MANSEQYQLDGGCCDGFYYESDCVEDFVDALEQASFHSQRLALGHEWKWLITTLHFALQGVCICVIRGHDTTGVDVLRDDNKKKVLAWLEDRSGEKLLQPMPSENLASLENLYCTAREKLDARRPSDVERAVRKLNALRASLMHPTADAHIVELGGMPGVLNRIFEIFQELVLERCTFGHHIDEQQLNRVQKALTNLRANVARWQREHAKSRSQEF